MRYLPLFLAFAFPLFNFAQTSPCTDFRFLEIIFAETEKTSGVQYGENTTIGGTSLDLLMDIYEPIGDTLSRRIPIILAAEGAFSGGSRDGLETLCRNFAQRGYVVFAIDTRPFDIPLTGSTTEEQMLDWLFKAATDVKAAVRFLRQQTENGNIYRVNPEIIFIGGVGTGAIAANHAAMVGPDDNVSTVFSDVVTANGGWEGNSNDIMDHSSEVRGVVSYSGGLVDASWLGVDGPLFVAFHDDADPEVPFAAGVFSPDGNASPLSLDGSSLLAQQATSLELYHELNTSTSDDHVSYLANGTRLNNTAAATAAFIHEVNCENIVSNLFELEVVERTVSVFPNPAADLVSVRTEAGQQVKSVQILDVLGRPVAHWEQRNTINISGLVQGVYFLVAEFSDAKVSRPIRWVKQ